MKKTGKRVGALALVLALTLAMLPGAAYAADIEIQAGAPALAVNTDTVMFAGQEWYVIGDENGGVYPHADSVTLLVKSESGNPYSNSAFRESGNTTYTTNPSEYLNSTLQTKMESIASDMNTASSKEYNLINSRASLDGIEGTSPLNQRLWPLSGTEWNTVYNATQSTGVSDLLKYGNYFWLRSPGDPSRGFVGWQDGSDFYYCSVHDTSVAVRPALSLNRASVIFTSAAAGGKSDATAGSGILSAAKPLTGAVKFTVKDAALTLASVTPQSVSGRIVTFNYAGATAGETLSTVVTDSSGEVRYYGKLLASTDGSGNGTGVDITVPADFTATDSLQIFVEELGISDAHTDFCSALVLMSIMGQIAPTTAQGEAETVTGNDGKITGVTTDMEYSDDGTIWTTCPGAEVTGLAQGNYQVRYAGYVSSGMAYLASDAQAVTVGAFNAPAPPSTGSGSYTPTYTRRTLADTPTGVQVTAGMDMGTRLNVTANTLHPAGCKACDEIRSRQAAGDVLALYDISLTGYHTGAYEVFIPFSGSDGYYTVLHCNKGVLEKQSGPYVNGGVSTIWAKLSPFAVVRGAEITMPDDIVVNPPKTGDAGSIGGFVMVLAGLCGMAVLRVARRRRMAD